ncbi:hypothetical protein [Companilactobacillus sp. FL22-1]|uniref:hypothetical protein n=1 Tax=Companilactobacillus sp. FL22-1 TaxID=3373892 RepID=UPI00375473A0
MKKVLICFVVVIVFIMLIVFTKSRYNQIYHEVKNLLFKIFPVLFGLGLFSLLYFINVRYKLNYSNIKNFNNVLESMVNFLSIVIGFYSAFYGMIISVLKSSFMKELNGSKYRQDLPKLLVISLLVSFLTLIITIFMQVLVAYSNKYIIGVYYIWSFLVGVFIAYALQTSLLSIAMIFGSEPIEKGSTKI